MSFARLACAALVPGLLTTGLAWGADDPVRDVHFQTVMQLINGNLRLPAERLMADFEAKSYPDGAAFLKVMQWKRAGQFKELAGDPALRQKLAADHTALEADLKQSKGLPPILAQVLSEMNADQLTALWDKIARKTNPDYPPRSSEGLSVIEGREVISLVKRLLEAADRDLEAKLAKIKEIDLVREKLPAEATEKVQNDALEQCCNKRLDYANALYSVIRATREVVMRTSEFRLDPSGKDTVERWLHARFTALLKDHNFASWDFEFGDYHPFLKHRLGVFAAEMIRLNKARPDLANIKLEVVVADELRKVIDWDTAPFKDAKVKDQVEQLKLDVWSDLFYWYLQMNDEKMLGDAIDAWERDFMRRDLYKLVDKQHPKREQAVGHMYILAARVYGAGGNPTKRDEMLSRLKSSGNYFKDAGRAWMSWIATQDNGQGDLEWASPITPTDVPTALEIAGTMMYERERAANPVTQTRFSMKALLALRNGLAGLPDPKSPDFQEQAPKIYLRYASALYRHGWSASAIAVAREGLGRFKPFWKSETKNSWIVHGKLNESGSAVQSLARMQVDLMGVLRKSAGTTDTSMSRITNDAIETLKIYDADAVKDLDLLPCVTLLQERKYSQALPKIEEYLKAHSDKPVMIYLKAQALNGIYGDLLGETKVESPAAKKVGEELVTVLSTLRAMVEPVAKGMKKAPKDQESSYRIGYQAYLSVSVYSLYKQEKYEEIVALLGADFWKTPPKDSSALTAASSYCMAVYKLTTGLMKDPKRVEDPAAFFVNWERVQLAQLAVDAAAAAAGQSDPSKVRDLRTNLAAVFEMVRRHSLRIVQAQQRDPKTLASGSATLSNLAGIQKRATLGFATLMEPVVKTSKDVELILSVAEAFREADEGSRAITFYELFRKLIDNDSLMSSFKTDPVACLKQFQDKLNVRSDYGSFWNGRASIPDLLIDSPDFIKNFVLAGKPKESWPEELRDYRRALTRIKEFQKTIEGDRSRLNENYAPMQESIKQLIELVQNLDRIGVVKLRLAKSYFEAKRFEEAGKLTDELYEGDQQDPAIMSLYADVRIQAIADGTPQDDAVVAKAKDIAIRLRNLMRGQRDPSVIKIYWKAVCQVMELCISSKDKDLESVKQTLEQNRVFKKHPVDDLCEPGEGERKVLDSESAEIIARYNRLSLVEGVNLPILFERIEKDGAVYFAPKKK